MAAKRFAVPTILAFALVAIALMLRGKGRLPQTPEDSVKALFEAAQRGDAPAYLAGLTGPLRSSFESTQSQIGTEAFAASLRDSVAGMKGFAVSSTGEAAFDRAELEVELVFSDHNQRQRFAVLRQRGGWLVDRIDNAETVKPSISYGAPVFDPGVSDTGPPTAK